MRRFHAKILFYRDDQQLLERSLRRFPKMSNDNEESAGKQTRIKKDKSKRKEPIDTVDTSQKKEKRKKVKSKGNHKSTLDRRFLHRYFRQAS